MKNSTLNKPSALGNGIHDNSDTEQSRACDTMEKVNPSSKPAKTKKLQKDICEKQMLCS